MVSVTISKTDLARRTREVLDQARRGQMIIVRSYGEDQVVLLDILDYRILKALASNVLAPDARLSIDDTEKAIHAYLNEDISLAKAAELLGVSRYELLERFERMGLPLRQGPQAMDEALDEVNAAR